MKTPKRTKAESAQDPVRSNFCFLDKFEHSVFQTTQSVLKDPRFQSLFTNPDMQIDANHESFKNIAPLVSRLTKQNVVVDEDEQGMSFICTCTFIVSDSRLTMIMMKKMQKKRI